MTRNVNGASISAALKAYWDQKGRKQKPTPKGRQPAAQDTSTPEDKNSPDIGAPKEGQSIEGHISQVQYDKTVKDMADDKKTVEGLKAKLKGAKKGERAKIQEKIKAVKEKMTQEGQTRKGLETYSSQQDNIARARQTVDKANHHIAKLQSSLQKNEMVISKIKESLEKAKNPSIRGNSKAVDPAKKALTLSKLQASLDKANSYPDTIKESIQKAKDAIDKSNKLIGSGGVKEKSLGPSFSFSERHVHLSQKTPLLWRELSKQESKVDWKYLNDQFNKHEDELKKDLVVVMVAALSYAVVRLKNRLASKDILGIGNMNIVTPNQLYPIISKHTKSAFEVGKKTASNEMKVSVPPTPTEKVQLMNLDSQILSESMAGLINSQAKQKAREGIAKAVATAAIVATVISAVKRQASKNIAHITGNIVGENINKGRQLVFTQNIERIQGFQRSEILDQRTCDMCAALDGQMVTADDPFAQLDQVHDSCRGEWVPILVDEEFNADEAGLPASIEEKFDTIGGAPTVNAFTQLNKPLTNDTKGIAADIESSLDVTQEDK